VAEEVVTAGVPEVVVDAPSEIGEGPLWHEEEQVLYWLDIANGQLNRYDPATGANERAHTHAGMIGGFTIQDDGALLLFCSGGRILRWRDGATATIVEEIPAEREGRFNDVIADPEGRVYCGTMPDPKGLARLYRLDTDGSLSLLYDDIGLSNGMGFSPDLTPFYHTDTNHYVIYRLDYDRGTGLVGNRSVLVRSPKENGTPDGMAVDRAGTIWSAHWGGGAIYHFAADGAPLGSVRFPVAQVSSVTFGGPRYDVAYATTAGGHQRGPELGALAGSLFRVDLGAIGTPPFRSRVKV
jgi:D-xylonolactonase